MLNLQWCHARAPRYALAQPPLDMHKPFASSSGPLDPRGRAPATPEAKDEAASPWHAFEFELDHLVLAAGSLGAGSAWLEERLGVALQPGGKHLGWGTHNRLLGLGHCTYLELIAPDPTQPPPAAPRPFGIDRPELRAMICREPRLVHYVMRTPRLDGALDALGYNPGPAREMARGELRWRITLPADGNPAGDGLLPTLIQWNVDPARHPARVLADRAVVLSALRICAPSPVIATLAGIDRDPRIALATAESERVAGLCAELATPAGTVVLR